MYVSPILHSTSISHFQFDGVHGICSVASGNFGCSGGLIDQSPGHAGRKLRLGRATIYRVTETVRVDFN